MKTILSKNLGRVVAAVALAVAGSSAFAVTTWNFGTIYPDQNPGGNKCSSTGGTKTDVNTSSDTVNVFIGNTYKCAPDSETGSLAVTAWSTTGSDSAYAAAGLVQYGTSGFGVKNATTASTTSATDTQSPQHSMDNNLNGIDLIQLNFGTDTVLESIGLGWYQTDSDVSVYRYVAGTGTTTDITGLTTGTLSSKGWELVGNYANLNTTWSSSNTSSDATVVAPNSVNAEGLSSSWWLISAYTGTSTIGNLDPGDDYMKVLAVATRAPSTPPDDNKVPEPGTLALMGVAIMGFVASRRRKQQAA